MSIGSFYNDQLYHVEEETASWERLERIEYCDQSLPRKENGVVESLKKMIKKLV